MKKIVEDWIFMAERDLKTSERLIKDDEPFTNIIAFHCQQAVEKYLKAYLLEKNVPLEKTHDLVKLNGKVLKIKDLGIDVNKLDHINEVYVETRYPGDIGLLPDGLPTLEEAKRFIEYAKEIETLINDALQDENMSPEKNE